MKPFKLLAAAASLFAVSACGTLTGIPAHGGGKRFSEEQRLVTSSIKLALQNIDVSPLKGKKVGIIFGLIADEGGGNIVGGRASITAILTQGAINTPSSSTSNSVEIFQVGNTSTTSGSSTSSGTSTSTGNNTTSGSSETTGSNSSTSTSETTGSSTTTSSSETTSEFSTDANQTTDTTSDTTNTNNTNGTTSGTSDSSTTQTSTTGTTNSGSTTNATEQTSSTSGNTGQAIVTGSQTNNSGSTSESRIALNYEGLGQYQNQTVPKSDAAYLMSQIRNKFLLNKITVSTPDDPSIDALVYVSVDILGTKRQRTDLLIYNNEMLRAETLIEMFALDRSGNVIMSPRVGNVETYYTEDYALWSGPFSIQRGAHQGAGLIGVNR